jgi:hypothetical protein
MKRINPNIRSLSLSVVLLSSLVGLWHIANSSAQKQSEPQGKWKVKVTGPKDPRVEANPMTAAEASEYTIENQIPAHLPLKVELLNLDKEPLLANIEVKVTNTSTKPIYFLDLTLYLPDFKLPEGPPLGFNFRYGRINLTNFSESLTAEDKSIKPGESFSFKISAERVAAFERRMARISRSQSDIRRIYLFFNELNFGDGTGFTSIGGIPVPSTTPDELPKCRDQLKSKQNTADTPADECCPGTPCSKLVTGFFSCQCPDPNDPNQGYSGRTTHTTSCTDPGGICATSVPLPIDVECNFGGSIFGCQEFTRLPYCTYDWQLCRWNCPSAGSLCTTPGWNGSCPPATVPDPITGLCCATVAGEGATAPVRSRPRVVASFRSRLWFALIVFAKARFCLTSKATDSI